MADLVLVLGLLVGGGLIYYLDKKRDVPTSKTVAKAKAREGPIVEKIIDKKTKKTIAVVTEPSPGVEKFHVIQPESREQTDRSAGRRTPSTAVKVHSVVGPPVAPRLPAGFTLGRAQKEKFKKPLKKPKHKVDVGTRNENRQSRDALLEAIRERRSLRPVAKIGKKSKRKAIVRHSKKRTMMEQLAERIHERRAYIREDDDIDDDDEWED